MNFIKESIDAIEKNRPNPQKIVSFNQKIQGFVFDREKNLINFILSNNTVVFYRYDSMQKVKEFNLKFLPSSVINFFHFIVFSNQHFFQVFDARASRFVTKNLPIYSGMSLFDVKAIDDKDFDDCMRVVFMLKSDSCQEFEEVDFTAHFLQFGFVIPKSRDFRFLERQEESLDFIQTKIENVRIRNLLVQVQAQSQTRQRRSEDQVTRLIGQIRELQARLGPGKDLSTRVDLASMTHSNHVASVDDSVANIQGENRRDQGLDELVDPEDK